MLYPEKYTLSILKGGIWWYTLATTILKKHNIVQSMLKFTKAYVMIEWKGEFCMEIRVLNYFLMVAREENITKAANLLHLTQPTLSRQLMQLEEELGVKLFHRSKHRIILTEDGMLLRRRAEEIVSLSEKTKDDLRHKKEQLAGRISIGSGELQFPISG